jgi:hypothetical protein
VGDEGLGIDAVSGDDADGVSHATWGVALMHWGRIGTMRRVRGLDRTSERAAQMVGSLRIGRRSLCDGSEDEVGSGRDAATADD